MTHDPADPLTYGVIAAVGSWPRDEAVVARAAQEARRRSTWLTLLHVDETATGGAGQEVLAQAEEAARSLVPDGVHTCHFVGSAPKGIVHCSRRADLVVLGAEGGSPLTRLLRGTVTANVAARALSLVEVVPTGAGVAPGPPVVDRVVAVSCADGDVDELAVVAFDQALRYDAAVFLMRAGADDPDVAGRLEAALDPWRSAHPAVTAEVVVLPGDPPEAILHLLEATDLLVALRGAGAAYWGRPDGVTRALLDRAPCPVVVVPPPARQHAS